MLANLVNETFLTIVKLRHKTNSVIFMTNKNEKQHTAQNKVYLYLFSFNKNNIGYGKIHLAKIQMHINPFRPTNYFSNHLWARTCLF